jgi:mono/diheme cytochrome c family protein
MESLTMSFRSFLVGAIAGPLVLALLALILTLGGFVPVAATHEDSELMQWWLHSTYQQRVARKASQVTAPDNLANDALIEEGARSFTSMCRGCHTPPGERTTAVSEGLNPPAPDMNTLLEHRRPTEAFVVIRDGVRMSGMPAFGPSHEEDQLWALVAFLEAMAGADARSFQTLIRQAKQNATADDGHDHAHMGDSGNDGEAPPGHEGHDHAH